ncbi:hypothetical protein BRADI_1g00287v3, partial [Brachypodium distachyon]
RHRGRSLPSPRPHRAATPPPTTPPPPPLAPSGGRTRRPASSLGRFRPRLRWIRSLPTPRAHRALRLPPALPPLLTPSGGRIHRPAASRGQSTAAASASSLAAPSGRHQPPQAARTKPLPHGLGPVWFGAFLVQ